MSIRFKMTTIVVAVVLVANSLLSFVTLRYLGSVWLGEVQTRVQRNLNAARAAYEKHIELIAAYLKGAARDGALIDAIEAANAAEIEALLADIHQAGGVDFVTLLDPQGRVMYRARSQQRGEDLADDPLVSSALEQRQIVTGTVIFSRDRLAAEGGDLAERARFELVPTPAARATTDTVRCDGMVVAAVVPVWDAARRIAGHALRRQSAQSPLRPGRRDQARGLPAGKVSGPRHRHRDDLPGGPADLRPTSRWTTGRVRSARG